MQRCDYCLKMPSNIEKMNIRPGCSFIINLQRIFLVVILYNACSTVHQAELNIDRSDKNKSVLTVHISVC